MQRHPCFGTTVERQCVRDDDVDLKAKRASSGEQQFVFIGGLQRSGTTLTKSLVLQLLGAHASGMEDKRRSVQKQDRLLGGIGGLEGKFVQSVYPRVFWLADRLGDCKPSLVEDADRCAGDMSKCTWVRHGGALIDPLAEMKRDWEYWWADRRASILVEKSPENIIVAGALQAIFWETSHFIFLTRHPLPWALALDTFKRTRRASLDDRFSAWLEAAELMVRNGERLRSWSWVPYELIGETGVLASALRALLPHAELSRAEPEKHELTAHLLSSNDRYARCWGLGVPLGSFEFAVSESSSCSTMLKLQKSFGSARNESLWRNRDVLQRAASLHECHISSFGYSFTLAPSGAVETSFQPALVRPSALIEALQRSLPSAPRRAPPRLDVVVLQMDDQRGCTLGLDCSEDASAISGGMKLRQAQIISKLQSQGFQVHLIGGASAFSWIERMEGCLRWRLRAVVALHTALTMYTKRHVAKGGVTARDWANLPVDTQEACASCIQPVRELVAQYPGELLDIAINRLGAITRDWTLVAVTDDIHHYRIMDATREETPGRLAMQDWLKRRETRIYSAADSVLAISEQDVQTIARLIGEDRSPAVRVFPYAPDVTPTWQIPYDDRNGGVLYVGTSHPVAKRSVMWFIHKVLPIISSGLQSHGVSCCTSSPLFTLAGRIGENMGTCTLTRTWSLCVKTSSKRSSSCCTRRRRFSWHPNI